MKENTIATNLEPHKCVIFVQSMKIGTHENKATHSRFMLKWLPIGVRSLIFVRILKREM